MRDGRVREPGAAPRGILLGLDPLAWLGIAGAAGWLAFLSAKAFSIDDPLFIWLARHISKAPLDFFGFSVLWYQSAEPMYEVSRNPPLAGYFLALAGSWFGWGERALHLSLVLPAAVVLATTAGIARQVGASGGGAVLLVAFTPAYLVTASNVGCDMLMLAFWTSAVLCWIVGFERRSRLLLLLACFLAGLAALSKYFGIAIVPLLLVHGLVKARRVGLWVGFLALPIAMLLGFDALTRDLYGAGHFLDAAKYAAGFEEHAHSWGRRFVVAAAFAGGGAATALICAPLLWSRRIWISGAALCAALILLSPHLLPVLGVPLGTSSSGAPWWLHSQLWLFVFGGISLVALCLTELRDRRDPESILLVAWTLGTFIFAGFVNWTTNGRSILPLVPPLALLILRRIGGSKPRAWPRVTAFVACGLLALGVSWADYRWAGDVREEARKIGREYSSQEGSLYFLGHWGFQYYMEESGATALDWSRHIIQPGDLLVAPLNNYLIPAWKLGPEYVERVEQIVSPSRFGHTMNMGASAGFYASERGVLPFGFGPANPDRYLVVRARTPLRFVGP